MKKHSTLNPLIFGIFCLAFGIYNKQIIIIILLGAAPIIISILLTIADYKKKKRCADACKSTTEKTEQTKPECVNPVKLPLKYEKLFNSQYFSTYAYASVIVDLETGKFYTVLFEGNRVGGHIGSYSPVNISDEISYKRVEELAAKTNDISAKKYLYNKEITEILQSKNNNDDNIIYRLHIVSIIEDFNQMQQRDFIAVDIHKYQFYRITEQVDNWGVSRYLMTPVDEDERCHQLNLSVKNILEEYNYDWLLLSDSLQNAEIVEITKEQRIYYKNKR